MSTFPRPSRALALTPVRYRTFHKVHHLSIDPTPFASFSFHPLEAGQFLVFARGCVVRRMHSLLRNSAGVGHRLHLHLHHAHPPLRSAGLPNVLLSHQCVRPSRLRIFPAHNKRLLSLEPSSLHKPHHRPPRSPQAVCSFRVRRLLSHAHPNPHVRTAEAAAAKAATLGFTPPFGTICFQPCCLPLNRPSPAIEALAGTLQALWSDNANSKHHAALFTEKYAACLQARGKTLFIPRGSFVRLLHQLRTQSTKRTRMHTAAMQRSHKQRGRRLG